MGKAKGKDRLDKYYHLAKEHGYRSRASFKLLQLDSKFNLLSSAHSVLDLCAAPGGWMQVAVEKSPVGSLIVGVDLAYIRPIRGAVAVKEDITTPKCRSVVKRIMGDNGVRAFELVLHDGSPDIGGAWSSEATSQNALVIDSIRIATDLLAPKGNFVTKVFRSQDYNAVLYCLRQLFEKVEVDKPLASRSTSAEIYVIGLKYKAPAKIDPRLLDVKHLFQGVKLPPKVVDPFNDKQKRHRDGYEDGVTTLRKTCSAADFVWSDTPLNILGSVTSIIFDDEASLPIRDQDLTTVEVKALCDDLRVLGKQDFKHLLKWRMHIRKALSPSQKAAPKITDVDPKGKVDEDESMLNEMEELTYAMERKKKREKKLRAKRLAKDKARKKTGMQSDVMEDGYTDHELFSLASIKGKRDLSVVDNSEYDEENADVVDSENEEAPKKSDSPSDADSEEERRRYDEQMEEFLDEAYERFVAKKEGSTKQRKRLKRSYATEGDLLEGDESEDAIHPDDQDSDNDRGDQETNPLVVPLDEDMPTRDEITANWFSQDVFDDEDDLENSKRDDVDDEDDMQVDKELEQPVPIQPVAKQPAKPTTQKTNKASKAQEDFEIVPAPATDSSDDSSSDESDEEDIDTKAEILACAKKMLRKKQREEMLDDAYNKYMNYDEGLPKWFVDEETRHWQPIKPVTKDEINAMKAQFKEINARPAKKVAEAKARKKRVAMRKMEKARKKANSISDQADISDRSKAKMIDKLYKKAIPERPKKELVVAKKGVQVRPGKGKVLVDRRMKKDARKHGMSKQQGKGKKGKKNAKGPKGKGFGIGNKGSGKNKGDNRGRR